MGTKRKYQSQSVEINYWHYVALGLLTIFLALSPKYFAYFNGVGLHTSSQYFFEKYISYGVIFGLVGILLAGLYQWRKGDIDQRHVFAWVGLILPISYYISTFAAESSYLSHISLYFQIGAYGFFVLGIVLAESKKFMDYFMYIYLLIGSLITVYSFSYMMGNQFKLDALSIAEGVRMASIFTYSNAYAAFLITLLLINIHYLVKASNRVIAICLAVSTLWVTASLLLTLSRGAMLALPIIVFITLLISGIRKQLLMFVYLIPSLIGALIIQNKLMLIGDATYAAIQQAMASNQTFQTISFFSQKSLSGWLTIFGTSVAMAGFIYLFDRFVLVHMEDRITRWETRRFSQLTIPTLYIVIGILGIVLLSTGALSSLLPETLAQRIDGITLNTHSVLERLTIYKDSFQIWQDHKWFGAGGGAWEALYDSYQSYPYASAQTHSYPIQVLLETGLFGFIFIGGFILYILIRYITIYIKHRKSDQEVSNLFLLVALSLFIHSLIDFEMSYFFFSAIVFLSLGVLAAENPKTYVKINRVQVKSWVKRSAGAVMIVITIITSTYVSNLLYSNSKYNESLQQLNERQGLNTLIQTIDRGLKRYPNHPFLLERAGLFNFNAFQQTHDEKYRTEAMKYIDKLNNVEPKMRSLSLIYYTDAIEVGDYERAAQIMDQAIQKSPFELSYYEKSLSSHYELFKSAIEKADISVQQEQRQAIEAVYMLAEDRYAELQQLNKAIIFVRPFVVNEGMKQIYDMTRE